MASANLADAASADAAWHALQSQIPTAVRAAERSLAAGTGSEADLRALLEFHQDFVTPLCTVFANALPCERALATISRWSPAGVCEIGAGAGLWARLLRARGVEVHAYDRETPALPWSRRCRRRHHRRRHRRRRRRRRRRHPFRSTGWACQSRG